MLNHGVRPRSVLADAIIGSHGHFSQWMFEVVEILGKHCDRAVRRVDRFDRFDLSADIRPILLVHYPSLQLIDAIERGDIRVIFLSEAPHLTLQFMRTVMQIPFLDSLRSQTASAIANLAIGRSEHTRVVERGSDRSVADLLKLIASHLELKPSSLVKEAVVERASRGQGQHALVDDVLRTEIEAASAARLTAAPADATQAEICREIIDPLLAMASGSQVRPVVWPTPVFTFYDAPNRQPPIAPIISGPSRNLYYGPYLYLPPTKYRVEVSLNFSDEISEIPFIIEVHAGSWLSKGRIERRRPGQFRGYFNLEHHDATTTVEIRLRNEVPVEQGQLSLVELMFFVEKEQAPRGF